MCTLEKTTIIPTGDPREILSKQILKMVVLVDNEQLVQFANDMALYPPQVDRHVLWFTEPNENELIELIKEFDPEFEREFNIGFDSILAFSLSTTNKIADYITSDEVIDLVRIGYSYTKAGLPEYN